MTLASGGLDLHTGISVEEAGAPVAELFERDASL